MEMSLELLETPKVAPLEDAMTLHDFQALQETERLEAERRELELEIAAQQEKLASANPFEALDAIAVRNITSETVKEVMQSLDDEFSKLLVEQKDRFLGMMGEKV